MVLITFGSWLLVIPFYPTRCSVCGTTKFSKAGLLSGAAVLIAIAIAGILMVGAFRKEPQTPAPIINAYEKSPKPQKKSKPAAAPSHGKVDYSDAVQVSPDQLRTSPRSYLHKRVGIIGATVTRTDTPETLEEHFGIRPPPGCELITQLNGFIAACAGFDQEQVFNKFSIGKDVGMACVVEVADEHIVLVDHCILFPSFSDVATQ